MASITLTIPDAFLALYNTRRTAYNAHPRVEASEMLPVITQASVQAFVRAYLKGRIRQTWGLTDPGDGSVVDADEAAMDGV